MTSAPMNVSSLLTTERAKYAAAWTCDRYAVVSPGVQYLPLFLEMAQPQPGAKVLDAGCGAGAGTAALLAAGFEVTALDFVDNAYTAAAPFIERPLWDDLHYPGLRLQDFAYCTDVLEHIPPALTMLVVHRLLAIAWRGVFLTVSTQPDSFGYYVGEPLHLTVQPFIWWRDHLATIATVVEARDLLNAAAFFVRRA